MVEAKAKELAVLQFRLGVPVEESALLEVRHRCMFPTLVILAISYLCIALPTAWRGAPPFFFGEMMSAWHEENKAD